MGKMIDQCLKNASGNPRLLGLGILASGSVFFFLCCKNRREKMGQRTTAHLPKKSRNRKKKQQKQGKAKETQNLASFLSGPEALGPYHS